MVHLPLKETTISRTMRQFNGKVTTIRRGYSRMLKGMLVRTYTLDGCESEYGIPYEFIRDWLVPLEDEVTE